MEMLKMIFKNVVRRKNQSALTVVIAMIVTAVFFTFVSVAYSSSEGLRISSERIGADILIYPDTAKASGTDIIFTGVSEMVYMNQRDVLEVLPEEMIEAVSSQFFLETLPGAGCCGTDSTIRIVGVECQQDFLLKPWSQYQKTENLETDQIAVGANLAYEVGDSMVILNHQFLVVDKLYTTETGMDDSIFMPIETLRELAEKFFPASSFDYLNCDEAVSSVFIKLKDNVSTEEFMVSLDTSDTHIAVETISSMKEKLNAQNDTIMYFLVLFGSIVVVLAVLSLYIQSYNWIANRKGEIGYLKSVGFKTSEILWLFLGEVWTQCLFGNVLGIIVGLNLYNMVNVKLQELFVMPSIELSILLAWILSMSSMLFAMLIVGVTALPNALHYTRMETHTIISKGNLD